MAPDEWRYVGIESLEPAVEPVLRGQSNTLVIAGPGAGKTELLAQRACYLLQTGLCPHPRRILAISFKRDAAKNLGQRVTRRCGKELARRFESHTFDAFAKQLLDRFLDGLPGEWRPSADYVVDTALDKTYKWQFDTFDPPDEIGTRGSVFTVNTKGLELRSVCDTAVLRNEPADGALVHWVARALWRRFITEMRPSRLSFPMIVTLATYILETNTAVLAALRATYSHVFLDEFQDTTGPQYTFIRRCFAETPTSLTAVGDNKQRIMLWAGAVPDIFERFQRDFAAKPARPVMNYRSSPELVTIQATLIRSMDSQAPIPRSHQTGPATGESCEILYFPHQEAEVRYLATQIKSWLGPGKLKPRDICILVKQLPEVWGGPIVDELARLGINARIETATQDTLAEPLVDLLLPFIKLAVFERAGVNWSEAISILRMVWNLDPNSDDRRQVERALSEWRRFMRTRLTAKQSDVGPLIRRIVALMGETQIRSTLPQYVQGTYLKKVMDDFESLICESWDSDGDWEKTLLRVEGVDSIPITTIHKSKGLEFDTVVFIGLEDAAFWSFKNEPQESTCAFFVAFSRAKRRVLFTFSEQRVVKDWGVVQRAPQRRQAISSLYDLLTQAGVPTRRIGD